MSTKNNTIASLYFKLKGNTLVLIDWANIFHAQQKNGWKVDLVQLYKFLLGHEYVSDIVFFYGTDKIESSALIALLGSKLTEIPRDQPAASALV